MLSRHFGVVAGAMVLGGLVAAAHGAMATEYFNGYGNGTIDLFGLNGGSGWTAPWAGDAFPDYASQSANPAFNLSYTATGYANTGNSYGANDGLSLSGGGTAGNTATRTLRAGGTTPDTGMNGTIWISALVTSGSNSSGDMLLWLDRPDVTNSFVGIRSLQGNLRYNGTNVFGPATEYAVSTTYLLLSKVVINASGTTDTIDLWINPNLAGGEAGLGAPKLSGANNTNVFGDAFSGIGVSFASTGKLDAIRVSNSATAFTDVTMVPEPVAFGSLAMAAGCLFLRRRRA